MSEDRHKETLTKPTATETLETQVTSKCSETSDQDFDSLLKEHLPLPRSMRVVINPRSLKKLWKIVHRQKFKTV